MDEQDKKEVRTSTLFNRLFKAADLEDFFTENSDEICQPPFHEYISELCRLKDTVPERIIKQSAIERTYGHQLFNGTRRPSRDKVIQLAFGFCLDIGSSQEMLKIARKSPLYPRIMRDAAILYCLNHHMSIIETQNLLHDLGLSLLGVNE